MITAGEDDEDDDARTNGPMRPRPRIACSTAAEVPPHRSCIGCRSDGADEFADIAAGRQPVLR